MLDLPDGKILTLEKLTKQLSEIYELELLLKNNPESVEKTLERIELTGTSDIGGAVNLEFILKYNCAGKDGKRLSLEELIKEYS